MKKSMVALAVMAASTGTAYADTSNVTIYGIVDVAFVSDKGISATNTVNKIDSGENGGFYNKNGSRLGFKGSEDLGSGLSAIFDVEAGINTDTGASDQNGVTFGRQSWVGLDSSDFGTVKAGRQYTLLYETITPIDPFDAGMAGAFNRLISTGGGANGKRVNNSITYATPSNLGGFKAKVLYGFGEQSGDSSHLREYGISAGYYNGPLSVFVVHHNANSAYDTVAGAMDANALSATNLPASVKNTAFGGAYDFGAAKLSLLYQVNKNDAPATLSSTDTRDTMAAVSVPTSEAGKLLFSYILHKDRATADADSNQMALGYTHELSKRTLLYTAVSRLANDPDAKIGVASTTPGATDKLFVAGIVFKF